MSQCCKAWVTPSVWRQEFGSSLMTPNPAAPHPLSPVLPHPGLGSALEGMLKAKCCFWNTDLVPGAGPSPSPGSGGLEGCPQGCTAGRGLGWDWNPGILGLECLGFTKRITELLFGAPIDLGPETQSPAVQRWSPKGLVHLGHL